MEGLKQIDLELFDKLQDWIEVVKSWERDLTLSCLLSAF